jgi:hypothetical protein
MSTRTLLFELEIEYESDVNEGDVRELENKLSTILEGHFYPDLSDKNAILPYWYNVRKVERA